MEDAEEALCSALDISISKCTPGASQSSAVRRKKGPTNAWFDDECKTARQAARIAEEREREVLHIENVVLPHTKKLRRETKSR
jgi:hypothetical protein